MRFGNCALALAVALVATVAARADVQTIGGGAAVAFTAPQGVLPLIDYRHAKLMPLPQGAGSAAIPSSEQSNANPGPARFMPGALGNGKLHPSKLPVAIEQPGGGYSPNDLIPNDFGTSNIPFTTARAAASGDNTQIYYPFAPAGKLFFNTGNGTFVCSAALIKPGVVVTAAHCVANFGKSQFYSGFQFVPAYTNGSAPFGVWYAQYSIVLLSYYNGTDSCHQRGVVCRDDVAVLVLAPQNGNNAGNYTGYYGVGWNGFGFVSSTAMITQIGYPGGLDNGLLMERNDAQGVVSSTYSYNTLIGSLMTIGGADGGPWLVNFGVAPTLTGTSFGRSPSNNVVVGVTSFSLSTDAYKRQGASSFTSTNILTLINGACTKYPGAC